MHSVYSCDRTYSVVGLKEGGAGNSVVGRDGDFHMRN